MKLRTIIFIIIFKQNKHQLIVQFSSLNREISELNGKGHEPSRAENSNDYDWVVWQRKTFVLQITIEISRISKVVPFFLHLPVIPKRDATIERPHCLCLISNFNCLLFSNFWRKYVVYEWKACNLAFWYSLSMWVGVEHDPSFYLGNTFQGFK